MGGTDRLMEAVQQAKARDYAAGLADGMRIALQLSIGERPDSGGNPYEGLHDEDYRIWARKAITAIEQVILEDGRDLR